MLTPLSARYLDLPQHYRLPARTRGGARQPRSRARACPFSHAAESLPFAAAECGTTTAGRYEICRRLVQTSFVVLVEIAAPEYVSMYALFVSIAEIEVPVTQLNSDAVYTRCVHPFTVQYP